MNIKHLVAILQYIIVLLIPEVVAQNPNSDFIMPKTNSKAVVNQQIAATIVEIHYHRPSVRQRVIFGELVPYGQVWRTGSDNATQISFSTEVNFGGAEIKAGVYELFTIPGEEKWIVILQEKRSQWGSYSYDPENDVARVSVLPVNLEDPVETFTISFDDIRSDDAVLNITWEKVRVPVRITIDLRATVIPDLEAALQTEGRRPYFHAAMFYFENDLDIDRAAELMRLALTDNPDHIGMLYRLALILESKGDITGAKAAARRSLEGTASVNDELRAEYTRLNTALLARLRQH